MAGVVAPLQTLYLPHAVGLESRASEPRHLRVAERVVEVERVKPMEAARANPELSHVTYVSVSPLAEPSTRNS